MTQLSIQESGFHSDLRTKSAINPSEIYDKLPKINCVPQELKMDYSRILNKPFFLKNFTWNTTDTPGTILTEVEDIFPRMMQSNPLADVPFSTCSLFRMRACFLLQVSGTPAHAGIIVASVLPLDINKNESNINYFLQAPHAFLSANESTPVCIEIPFYCASPLCRTGLNESDYVGHETLDYASLNIVVLNQLAASTNASTALTISAHAVIREAEFYVPRPFDVNWANYSGVKIPISEQKKEDKTRGFKAEGLMSTLYHIPTRIFDSVATGAKEITGDVIDAARQGLRSFTGFHNPNVPTPMSRVIQTTRNFHNAVDVPTFYEKMDQHATFDRITDDFQFNTNQDEMDLKFILSKPALIGKVKVKTSDTSGTLLASFPISPCIETSTTSFFSPLRLFYEASRYWSGSLQLHIQSSMTNFQFCKILVARVHMSNRNMLTKYPPMNALHNVMTSTLEFSAGGQVQTIDLPFCSSLEQLECTKWLDLNAIQHGMVYVYLLQPLTTNGSSPTEMFFNFFMNAGQDFQYYGYSTDLINTEPTTTLLKTDSDEKIRELKEETEKIVFRNDYAKEYFNSMTQRNKETQIQFLGRRLMEFRATEAAIVAHAKITQQMSPNISSKELNNMLVKLYNMSTYNLVPSTQIESNMKDIIISARKMIYDFSVKDWKAESATGVETIAPVSAQDGIINTKEENHENDLRCCDFKPMVNIRDYIRRIQPLASYKASFSKKLESFSISGVLQSSESTSMQKSIFNLYHGFNGGFKLKVRVFHPNPTIFYVPPGGIYDSASQAYRVTVPVSSNTAQSVYDRFNATANIVQFSTPLIEEPVNAMTHDRLYSQFELVVPNMNPCRFFTNNYDANPAFLPVSYSGALGHLVISLNEAPAEQVVVLFWFSFTDETRFGHQVLANRNKVETITEGVLEGRRISVFNRAALSDTAPPATSEDFKCYYFNSST